MYNINRILPLIIFVVMTSCQKIPQQDTAVLSERTQAMVDFFLSENKGWLSDGQQLVVEGIDDNGSSIYLDIWENDTSVFKPYGKYNGMVHYKGYDILLYGDSWNEFFWTCDTIYDISDMNNSERVCFYDPIEWYICIFCSDTTINRLESEFRSFSSLPYRKYHSILCDSLQTIINP